MITYWPRIIWFEKVGSVEMSEPIHIISLGAGVHWIPKCEGEPSGFRWMSWHFISEPYESLRQAIDAIKKGDGE